MQSDRYRHAVCRRCLHRHGVVGAQSAACHVKSGHINSNFGETDMNISRRRFGSLVGSGVAAGSFLPTWLNGHAMAQGAASRITHAISAGDISSLDPTLAWVSSEAPIVTVVHQSLVAY